jgi:uncharacterized SAM-binding protein YcdF (DUF218 family)
MMVRRLTQISFLVILLWGIGFGYFLYFINNQPNLNYKEESNKADGVVVLTGGNMRVAQGFIMLKEDKANELLISGVGKDIDLEKLLNVYSANSIMANTLSRITLGYEAENTKSNADEAYMWAEARGFESLIIVTAHYHMPRAMKEFSRQMPAAGRYELLSQPVIPAEFRENNWWMNSHNMILLIKEYNKLLITYILN